MSGQRTTAEMIAWYNTHRSTATLGFNPDGRCQQIVRTARNIGPGAPSALAAALATPREERVYDVARMRTGMVLYFDDPNDDNPFGHVVSIRGEDSKRAPDDISRLFLETNSVHSGQLTMVRGDYFKPHWGDAVQWAGKSINGVLLDLPEVVKPPKPPIMPAGRVKRLEHWIDVLNDLIEEARQNNQPRYVRSLRESKRHLRETIESFGRPRG